MIVYKVINNKTSRMYFGITCDMYNRKHCHKNMSKKQNRNKPGGKTPFYDAIRKYGWDNFTWEILSECSKEEACEMEITLIETNKEECYNLHKGGEIGFSMRDKSPEDYKSWKNKLKKKRVGRKPALGMKHTDENKKLFKDVSRKYWDSQETYSEDVLDYSFKEANIKFGISKTHYYRLRKRALTND